MTGLRCVRMELGEPDESGRRRPVVIPGSEFVIPADMVVVAIGTRSNPLLTSTAPDLRVTAWGYIETDQFGLTSMPASSPAATSSAGRRPSFSPWATGSAAAAMHSYLSGVWPPPVEPGPEPTPKKHAPAASATETVVVGA